MQSSLKKSLYLGLAALSFASVAAVSTTASAKSYAKAGAYTTLSTAAEKRNVEATGTNALYTKPGTVKGAKVVASKATMAKLASSKKSADYFRAYGQKTTNRGSVYYRVVTMDGKYRGYIYGGKTAGTFAGGVKSAETLTAATMPATKTVYFANPGKTNVTWTSPKYTQYQASKNVTSTEPFASDPLTITDAKTKTREGSLYYYVKDAKNPSVSGWIYSKAVTTDSSVAYNQASDVKVNFVGTDGTTVKSTTLQKLIKNNTDNTASDNANTIANEKGTQVGFDATTKAKAADWNNSVLKGTGYTADLSTSYNQAALLAAKTGDTISIVVSKGQEASVNISLYAKTADATKNDKLTPSTATGTNSADVSEIVKVPALSKSFSGISGASYTGTELVNYLTTNKADVLYSNNFTTAGGKNTAIADDADDATVAASSYVKYELVSGYDGTFGSDSAQAVYKATTLKGASPARANWTDKTTGSSVFD